MPSAPDATPTHLGFFARLALAWRILVDVAFADAATRANVPQLPAPERTVERVVDRPVEVRVEVEKLVEKVVERTTVDHKGGALLLLSLLQREARLVDFAMEDIAGASDADVGAGARVVHQGLKKALAQWVELQPIRSEAEGSRVTLAPGFDAGRVRLTGNVRGQPPFTGTLMHAGWQAGAVHLPERHSDVDANVIAQAEVGL